MLIGPLSTEPREQMVWVRARRLARSFSQMFDAHQVPWARWALLVQRSGGGGFLAECYAQAGEEILVARPSSVPLLAHAAALNNAWSHAGDFSAIHLRVRRLGPTIVAIDCHTLAKTPSLPESYGDGHDQARRGYALLSLEI